MADEPPLPPDSEAAQRARAYNEWLARRRGNSTAEAFAAGWKAGVEFETKRKTIEEEDERVNTL